ncbi:S1 family peptidase [Stenotrophomonas sp. PD6]|uniref:S1 family peptidase n=1 Tax=Stenotrophomonas sp. PD6 TaxID=3368612 RepID=UPI003BA2B3FA
MIPIQTNTLARVFFIKAAQYGTAFTIDVEGAEFLVTARHLFDLAAATHPISVFRYNRWITLDPAAIEFSKSEADIAVIRLHERLTPEHLKISPSIARYVLGQDVYILGFPYKMHEDVGSMLNGYPCALLKRGTAASLGAGDSGVLFVDTLCNEGFSGGPVVFSPIGEPNSLQIAGVISGYRTEREPVLSKNDGEPTGDYIEVNTGLLKAYNIKLAVELANRMARQS